MDKAVVHTQTQFATVRTGRATPSLVERITIDYYGAQVPLQQVVVDLGSRGPPIADQAARSRFARRHRKGHPRQRPRRVAQQRRHLDPPVAAAADRGASPGVREGGQDHGRGRPHRPPQRPARRPQDCSRRPRRTARSPPTNSSAPRRNSRRSPTSTSSTSTPLWGAKSRSCSRYERRRTCSRYEWKAISMSDDMWRPGDKNPRRPGPARERDGRVRRRRVRRSACSVRRRSSRSPRSTIAAHGPPPATS